MDIADIIFSPDVPTRIKHAVINMVDESVAKGVFVDGNTPVLTPTDSNDDVNGSQHARNGGTDFTYRDATGDDVADADSLGVYEYFLGSSGCYTGHYYHGSDHFTAVVIDPPAYAATVYV